MLKCGCKQTVAIANNNVRDALLTFKQSREQKFCLIFCSHVGVAGNKYYAFSKFISIGEYRVVIVIVVLAFRESVDKVEGNSVKSKWQSFYQIEVTIRQITLSLCNLVSRTVVDVVAELTFQLSNKYIAYNTLVDARKFSMELLVIDEFKNLVLYCLQDIQSIAIIYGINKVE